MTDQEVRSPTPHGDQSETKALLLRRALFLFMAKSYGSVSMESLLLETGLSKGAIYHHFKGKEALFRSVVDTFLFEAFGTLRGVLPLEGDTPLLNTLQYALAARERYIQTMRQLTEYQQNDFAFYRLIMQAEEFYEGFAERVKAMVEAERLAWRRAINYAIRARELHPDLDVELYVTLIMAIPPGIGLTSLFTATLSMDSFREVYMRLYRTMRAYK